MFTHYIYTKKGLLWQVGARVGVGCQIVKVYKAGYN